MDDAAHPDVPGSARAMRAGPATPAQFCVSGFSVVHRKPVQFVGLK